MVQLHQLMSATWAQAHVRHPWLSPFTMKRKVCHNDSDDLGLEEDEPSDVPRPTKRRRYSTLEHGFAHLSLAHDFPISGKVESVEDVEMPMESDAPTFTVASPSSVEESIPVIDNDVRMRKSTWYEPEPDRIVITDLESSSDEETDAQESGDLYVSPALLDHIRSHRFGSNLKGPPSQALVLYRPMPRTVTTYEDAAAKANAIAPIKKSTKKEEDAMDLEP
ncbi:hypothetical protein F5887DRAFT_629900 [Amanita rubescens]|nr:hypothetical protein F5887DRAFT_629900 [Amanita rubescens]